MIRNEYKKIKRVQEEERGDGGGSEWRKDIIYKVKKRKCLDHECKSFRNIQDGGQL